MITFVYPRDDWKAAEIAVKLQALAASQNIKVYSTPKNVRRDDEEIAKKLAKTKYAIFIAYDADAIDTNTIWELESLLGLGIEIYSVVPHVFVSELQRLGISQNIYPYSYGGSTELINSVKQLVTHLEEKSKTSEYTIKSKSQEGTTGPDEALSLLLLLGMLLFFLWLIFGKSDQ